MTLWQQLTSAVSRLLSPSQLTIGSAGGESFAQAEYDAEHAGSAIAAYPWARVGVAALAVNLAQLPVVALDPRTGQRVQDHWMLALLKRPDPSMGRVRWWRQLVADLKTSGNIYCRITRNARGEVVRLRRMHPRGWQVVTDGMGDIVAWKDAAGREWSKDQIWHVGDISWRDDKALQHIGESPIRPLDMPIRAATAARAQAATAAKRGRLEGVLTTNMPLSDDRAEQVAGRFEDKRRGSNATIVLGGGLYKYQPLSLSPRDTEFAELDDRCAAETLSVLGVPPVRAQLPSANYGAAKQEMRQYWENIQGDCELIDDALTLLCAEQVIIRHSFEGVEALQTSRTERLSRVQQWVQLGASPWAAARYEGFVDPPLDESTQPRDAASPPPNPATQTDTPQARTAPAPYERIQSVLDDARGWIEEAIQAGQLEDPETRYRLAAYLSGGPLAPIAERVADDLVDATACALTLDHRINCDTLPAFGRDHARMLAEELEA